MGFCVVFSCGPFVWTFRVGRGRREGGGGGGREEGVGGYEAMLGAKVGTRLSKFVFVFEKPPDLLDASASTLTKYRACAQL